MDEKIEKLLKGNCYDVLEALEIMVFDIPKEEQEEAKIRLVINILKTHILELDYKANRTSSDG